VTEQRGMSLVAALFVMVVLALLCLFAVRVGASGEQGATAQVLQSRAEAAARSGIEYGANRALRAASCPNLATVGLTQSTLAGFTLTVQCTRADHLIGAVTYQTYLIDSLAQRGVYGTADYAARRMTKTVTNAP